MSAIPWDQIGNLWPALLAMIALNAALFLLVLRFTANLKPLVRKISAILLVTLALGYAWIWADGTLPINLLPLTNVIVLGNFTPLFCAMLAGVLCSYPAIPKLRRTLVGVVLGAFIILGIVSPILGRRPATHTKVSGEVCMQTSESTCSAAAAVSLLRAYGIPATETEMAGLCLTTEKGTNLAGLYRGLRIKTQGTPYQVAVTRATLDDLRVGNALPAILNMRLSSRVARAEPRYVTQWEWTVGQTHTVLFMGFADNNEVIMGDPSFGKERWKVKALSDLWSGECIQLVRR